MNYRRTSMLRNRIMTMAARITVLAGREARVGMLMELHSELEQALAEEGVVLPCHDEEPNGRG